MCNNFFFSKLETLIFQLLCVSTHISFAKVNEVTICLNGTKTSHGVVVFLKYLEALGYLGFALLCTTNGDEMTKKNYGITFEKFVIFRYM
jgi:hypothetical protein